MKCKFITISLIAFVATGIFSACNSSREKAGGSMNGNDSTEELRAWVLDTVKASKSEWEVFKADAQDKIRKNDDSLRVFRKRIEKEDTKVKAKYDREITKLEEKNNELKAKLTNYKDEGKDKLEKFKADFNNDMDTLETYMKGKFYLY